MLSRGIPLRIQRAWGNRPMLSSGIGNRATKRFGTGNSAFDVFSRKPGTGGNSITFAVVVPATANAAASVTVAGNAVTFNSATDGQATPAATSRVIDMARIVNSDATARPLVHVQNAPQSDGTGVVAAVAATALAGAV